MFVPSHQQVSEDLKTRYHQLGDTKDDLPSNLFCRCCAFFFPAVLRYVSSSTSFWKDMNDLYHRLVKHKDDIVRRSLAYSLHEVAQIIGVASTERYLVKIQSCFLVDKIDIQMGVVKNLAKFWKALGPAARQLQARVGVAGKRDLVAARYRDELRREPVVASATADQLATGRAGAAGGAGDRSRGNHARVHEAAGRPCRGDSRADVVMRGRCEFQGEGHVCRAGSDDEG